MKTFIFFSIRLTIPLFLLLSITPSNSLYTQVSLTTGGYFQDFGTTAIGTNWTSGATSGTMRGWYFSGTNRGSVNIVSTTSPNANSSNSGGIYTYTCGGNAMIGSRASGSANNLYYGVRLKNTSGAAITRIEVSFDWFQVSLAQSGSNVNTIQFHYQTGASVTSLTGGTWTSVPGLNFSSTTNGPSGSNQLQWYPPCQAAYSSQRGSNSECIAVTIPAGSEIMLRWYDVDDSQNDHHMGIDNVRILAFDENGGSCISPLSTGVTRFEGVYENLQSNLSWTAHSEQNNSHYTVTRSRDGALWQLIGTVQGAGFSDESTSYRLTDHSPESGINYYRLEATDLDGEITFKDIIAVTANQPGIYYNEVLSSIELSDESDIRIYSTDGRLVAEAVNSSSIPFHHSGVFIVHFPKTGTTERIFIK